MPQQDAKTRVPQIGDWWARCCVLDLKRIRDAHDLQEAQEAQALWLEDGEGAFEGIWATETEAREALAQGTSHT